MPLFDNLKRGIFWLGGISLTALWYILAEGWLIIVVKIFGFFWSILIVTLVTFILACIVIHFATSSRNVGKFRDWLKEKEEHLSKKAKTTVTGGKILAVANTSVFLGPMVGAILMLMFNVEKKKVYFYSIFCSILCAVFWSGFYSGIFWEIKNIMGK